MKHKIQKLNTYGRSKWTNCACFRPDSEGEAKELLLKHKNNNLLIRGSGLSYSDCSLLSNGKIIDARRLNNFISFDKETKILEVQGGVTFRDLLSFNKNYIPAIIPGTLNATLAGSIANDVHGKNNHKFGSIGYEIKSFNLDQGITTLECDEINNPDLFYATIGGLGLTGFITRIKIRLLESNQMVVAKSYKFKSFNVLLDYMQTDGLNYDFQVAWLDWLNNSEKSVYSYANYTKENKSFNELKKILLPKFPFKLISPLLIKQFNRYFYDKKHFDNQIMPIWKFNNPLEFIDNWDCLYGKSGLLQFQALIPISKRNHLMELREILNSYNAAPLLVVLKYFTMKGQGLLSFCEPGFCIAIDLINEEKSILAIKAMNELVTKINGKIYLAKDRFLTDTQFKSMYTNHDVFMSILKKYQSPFNSDLSIRIGLNHDY